MDLSIIAWILTKFTYTVTVTFMFVFSWFVWTIAGETLGILTFLLLTGVSISIYLDNTL